jgi:ATP-dependent DNA ligase
VTKRGTRGRHDCRRPDRGLSDGMLWRTFAPARRPPGFIEPCLPTLGRSAPNGPQWAYEIKHDGFRFICRRDGDRVRVFSRSGHDWTDRVPAIAEALGALRVMSVTIDGEGVVCGQDGVSDFDQLRAAVGRNGRVAAHPRAALLPRTLLPAARSWVRDATRGTTGQYSCSQPGGFFK